MFCKINNNKCRWWHYKCNDRTVQKLAWWRLSTKWVSPWDWMHSLMFSKGLSDWLPSYIKAFEMVHELFKMACVFFWGEQTSSVHSHTHNFNLFVQTYMKTHVHTLPSFLPQHPCMHTYALACINNVNSAHPCTPCLMRPSYEFHIYMHTYS